MNKKAVKAIKKLIKLELYLGALLLVFTLNNALADTPVSLFESHAGNVNFVGAQATRRTQPNTVNSCTVLGANITNTAIITGIPAGATIKAAHLYWAGSYSTQAGSTRITPDYSVVFEGSNVTAPANRRYTANYTVDAISVDFYSGVADVTAQVNIERNGTYSFSGLSVNTAGQHCTTSSVLAGWSLVIIYEDVSEDFRVVNLYEGFQAFRGQSIVLTPNNFRIPIAPINGKHAHITWEGDVGNSTPRNGFTERLSFNGTTLTDAANPINNQFNSTSTILSSTPSTGVNDLASYGIDSDAYTIDAFLTAGDTSATSTYSSGGDLVLLSSEIISVTNTPVSDLAINKTHNGTFAVGQNATYTLSVNNNGPISEPGPVVVTDALPAGLTYVSATGSGWNCGAVGQNVTCTRAGSLANGASASDITLTVAVSLPASPSVTNTANVSGVNFDNVSGNDSDSDTVAVTTAPNILFQKASSTLSDPYNGTSNPKAIPGALVEYTLTASNSGSGAADNGTIVISDSVPANTKLYVDDISGAGTGPIRFVDGTPPSGLGYTFTNLASATDNIRFSNNNGGNYLYIPTPDAEGADNSVTDIQITTVGSFLAPSGAGDPSFQLKFRVIVE